MAESADAAVWRGVLIEESLSRGDLLDRVRVVKTRSTGLEGEAGSRRLRFHNVEVAPADLGPVILLAMATLKERRWYFHLTGERAMYVVLRNAAFRIERGDQAQIDHVRRYAMDQGIRKEQLGFESLLEDPYDE